jgi:cytochrome c
LFKRGSPIRQVRHAFAGALLVLVAGCGNAEEEPAAADMPDARPPAADAAAPEPAPVEPAPAAADVDEGRAGPLPAEPEVPAPPDPTPVEPVAPPLATEEPGLTPELAAMIEAADTIAGRTYAQRCAGCHEVDPATQGPAAAQIGPPLGDVVGRPIGTVAGFDYSPVFDLMAETEAIWTPARLDLFLADPPGTVPGTAMSAVSVPSPLDRANLIAFLSDLAGGERGDGADPELLGMIAAADPEEGRTLAARCSGCHRYEADAAPLIGPNLADIVGAPIGTAAGFAYSPAMQALADGGAVWSFELLDDFLQSPATAVPGTRMGFAGIADAGDRAAVIAFLRSLSSDPVPLFAPTEGVGNERAGLEPVGFDAQQVERGRNYYSQLDCVRCHGVDLRGEIDMREDGFGVAPALIGPNFTLRWYRGSVAALFAFLEAEKPRGDPGTYAADVYADLIAYVLSRNGFAPSGVALPADPAALELMGFYQ